MPRLLARRDSCVERRFVFASLNVTDGAGDLVSYDVQTKRAFGDHADASGNDLWGCH